MIMAVPDWVLTYCGSLWPSLILLVHSSWIVGTSGVTTSILNFIFHINPETAPALAQATMTVKHAAITGNPNVHQLTGLGRPITLSYLPMFFALSGFLVTGSALRTGRWSPFSACGSSGCYRRCS